MNYLHFFFGTPKRVFAWMVFILLGFALANPEIIRLAIHNLLAAILSGIAPFIGSLLTLIVVALVIKMMWRGGSGKGRRH